MLAGIRFQHPKLWGECMPDFREITEYDQYLFGQGEHYEMYEKLGAHVTEKNGESGVYFAVWAPRALAVRLVGDFNNWTGNAHVMKRNDPLGIYDLFVPGLVPGTVYQYEIITQDGQTQYKTDPFANWAQLRPGTASIVADIDTFLWTDDKWLAKRRQKDMLEKPLAVYEVHIGSWKRHKADYEAGFYNYREFAHEITEYVKDMGYTHVELMGIAEHPYDGSWGYQVTGYFAPTARYGTPQDFMYMINYLHKNKIGVILDWVPAHFPKDPHGLAQFDGSCLFEYAEEWKREHPDWGTRVFDYGKNEVINFLMASALFWVEKMHVDGLRVDAVASMLYLDYGRPYGKWQPNKYGENKNLEAVEFFRKLNKRMKKRNPGVMMIAEESTAWPKVTGKIKEDGLGFTFKWNMGWMHDFLAYMKLDPLFRSGSHHKMTFGMMYAYNENYMLVLSHDEVVHMKGAMLEKMPGDVTEKIANLKVGYTFMMGHPGKKLLFMGQDFGQNREWSENRALDWELLEMQPHLELKEFVKSLLHIYRKYPALYEGDYERKGFKWMNADDCDRSIYSFVRKASGKDKNLLFICNFTPAARPDYRIGVPKQRTYKLILDSEAGVFGGNADEDKKTDYIAEPVTCDGQEYSFEYALPAYGAAVFEY